MNSLNSFLDRREAGRTLAEHLGEYAGRPDVTVLALPRGGLPIAYEIARTLSVPLDVFIVPVGNDEEGLPIRTGERASPG